MMACVGDEGVVRIQWRPEPDGTGELRVEARAGTGFAGCASAWFNKSSVEDFADRIRQYPLPGDIDVELVGGSQPLGGELLIQVGLYVYPVGIRGQVGVALELARSPWQSPAMRPREQHRASFEVLTTYQRLDEFSGELRHLLAGDIDTAQIDGESLI